MDVITCHYMTITCHVIDSGACNCHVMVDIDHYMTYMSITCFRQFQAFSLHDHYMTM